MANENNRDKSGERRRKLFSINEQIDKIQGVYFDNYTQNIDRRISSLAERQHRLLDKLYDSIEKEEKDRIKQSFNDRQDAMRKSLDDWKSYNDQINTDLTLADKFASNVFYWNRRRDLRDLERESRYRFQDIEENAEKLADTIEDRFSSLSDSLRDWSTALNVNDLASNMEDTQMSMRDIRIDLQKYMDLSDEEWSKLKSQANEFSKSTDYAISKLDYLENIDAVVKFGYDDKELAAAIAQYTSKFENMTGVAADQLGNIFEVSTSEGMGGEEYIRTITSQMMKIQQTSGLYTNAEDLVSVYDDNIAMLRNLAGGDNDLLATYLDQTMALRTAVNASYLDGLDEKLFEMMSTPLSEMSDSMLMIGGAQIQQLMQKGDFKSAAQMYVDNLNKYLNQASNSSQKLELLNALGLDDPNLQGKIMEEGNLEDFVSSYDQAMNIIDEQTDTMEKFVDTYEPQTSKLERLKNKFKTSSIADTIDDIANELDISLAEGMLIGSGAISIGKTLFGGIKKLGGLFGLGAGSAGATSAVTGGLGSLLSGAGNIGSSLLAGAKGLGTSAVLNLGVLGESLIAAGGGSAAGASVGGLAAAGGASVAGGLVGGAGLLSGIYDIYKGITGKEMSSKEKQDQYFSGGTKIGMVGGGAAAGAALGSVIPVLGTSVGALIGAGVGGIGALISGTKVGNALSDAWDWTKETASNLWDNVSEWGSNTWDGITEKASSSWDYITITAENALSGIGDFFSGIWDNITSKVDSAKNWITDKAGQAWDGITGFFSGPKDKSDQMNEISGSHRLGLRYVPYDGYLSELHKGEAVLTEAQANQWRNNSLDEKNDNSYWAPNDRTSTLSDKESSVVNNYYYNEVINDENSSDEEDATITELIVTLKSISKDIRKTIKESSITDSSQQNKLTQLLLSSRLRSSASNSIFNFAK